MAYTTEQEKKLTELQGNVVTSTVRYNEASDAAGNAFIALKQCSDARDSVNPNHIAYVGSGGNYTGSVFQIAVSQNMDKACHIDTYNKLNQAYIDLEAERVKRDGDLKTAKLSLNNFLTAIANGQQVSTELDEIVANVENDTTNYLSDLQQEKAQKDKAATEKMWIIIAVVAGSLIVLTIAGIAIYKYSTKPKS
jgi:hypothetical protein